MENIENSSLDSDFSFVGYFMLLSVASLYSIEWQDDTQIGKDWKEAGIA
jgi:hypothetical protein